MCRIFAVDLRYYSIKSFTPCFLFSERKIEVFMTQYRNIEGSTITPKLHILEDHVIPFITHYDMDLNCLGSRVEKSCIMFSIKFTSGVTVCQEIKVTNSLQH